MAPHVITGSMSISARERPEVLGPKKGMSLFETEEALKLKSFGLMKSYSSDPLSSGSSIQTNSSYDSSWEF
jgi:hypothetical protein